MRYAVTFFTLIMIFMTGCKDETTTQPTTPTPKDPATAPRASVDRFSAGAGNLFVRDTMNGLPGANVAVNFDAEPFLSKGFGPAGELVSYYNFDVQPTTPAPIYVLFKDGASSPVADQLNIVDVIPGDAGYNDFWQVIKVTVPDDYVANVVTSYSEIVTAGYTMETLPTIVNCPVVPEGSTASMRVDGGDAGLVMGWYKGEVVFYFSFEALSATGTVPLSPIYVTFNINPNPSDPTSGPASGFMTEPGSDQTHNVVATLPGDMGYSPLWLVNIYDNADFDTVTDLASAQMANLLVPGAANVNCPIVSAP